MAVRRYYIGLKGFQQNAPKLGECETSEYFTILLTNIEKLQHAKIIARINLFFREQTTPGKVEPDMFDSLYKVGFLTEQDKQKIENNTETEGPAIITSVSKRYKWNQPEAKAVSTLEWLLQQYKDYGLNGDVNYLDEWQAQIESRDDKLRAKAAIAGDHYLIGKLYLEMRTQGYGDIFIALSVREFIKALQLTQDGTDKYNLVATIRTTLGSHGIMLSHGNIMTHLKSYQERGVRPY